MDAWSADVVDWLRNLRNPIRVHPVVVAVVRGLIPIDAKATPGAPSTEVCRPTRGWRRMNEVHEVGTVGVELHPLECVF